jgi:uncharacterized membrane protein
MIALDGNKLLILREQMTDDSTPSTEARKFNQVLHTRVSFLCFSAGAV